MKILQGLNHISKNSVVLIDLPESSTDSSIATIKELLDLIKSFDPIFMENYKIEDGVLQIESHFTQIWREAEPHLLKLAQEQGDKEETKNYILNDIVKAQIKSMSTIVSLKGALDLGLETNVFLMHEGVDYFEPGKTSQWNRYYKVGMGKRSGVLLGGGTSRDSHLAVKIQRDKQITNTLIDRLAFPNAKWEILESEEHLKEIFDNYPTPVVIKPAGLTQGKGVTTNIFNMEQAIKAYQYAQKAIGTKSRSEWQTKIMIQQQVKGDDYRLLVVNGKLEVATKRVPAFVTGDGKSSIRELIEETNKDPRRNMNNPAHTLKPIAFDEMLDQFLAEQEISLITVPKKDERVYVRKVASMSQGGITEDFTEKVHPHIRSIAESMASTIHANVVGIDVICQDISKPLTIENGSFIEMNTMPEIYLNIFPVIGRSYPEVGQRIIEGIVDMEKKVESWVFVGYSEDEMKEEITRNGGFGNKKIGILSGNKYMINDQFMSEYTDHWTALKSMKINSSLDQLVVRYENWNEVREYGLGFRFVDRLFVQDPSNRTLPFPFDKYEEIKEFFLK